MSLNALIAQGSKPLQVEDPVNQLAKVMQIQGAQRQAQLGEMQMAEFGEKRERARGLRDLLAQTYDTPDAREAALMRGGYVDEATKLSTDRRANIKADADNQKSLLEAQLKKFEVAGQIMSGVTDQATWDQARQRAAQVFGPEAAAQMPAQYDPALVEQKRQQAMSVQQQVEAKYKALTFQETQANNLRVDERTKRGQDMTAQTAANAQALTKRGQDMVDDRSRDQIATSLTKPFEVTGEDGKPVLVQQDKQGNIRPVQGYLPKQGASKPLTEGQAKAALFGSRMQAAESIFDELADKGVTTSIPGSRSGYGVGAAINALQPGERQRLDQAKRDFINAVLRRESGAVISQQEFDNAELQYFPQPGETPEQKAQKKANRELATRGILAEVPDAENRVAKIRGTAAPVSPNIDALLNKYK